MSRSLLAMKKRIALDAEKARCGPKGIPGMSAESLRLTMPNKRKHKARKRKLSKSPSRP